jgi:dUTP pyrophosphatase
VEVLPDGTLPSKAHEDDAGIDVYATSDIVIYPGQIIKHPLNIRLKIPPGSYLSIESKSGLGSKGLLVYSGVIDAGYRGIPHVVMTNLCSRDESGALLDPEIAKIVIRKGSKLAQMIPYPFSPDYYIKQVDVVDTNTARAGGGFGSSGI